MSVSNTNKIVSKFMKNEDLMPVLNTLTDSTTYSNKVLFKKTGQIVSIDTLKPTFRHSVIATKAFEARSFKHQQNFIFDESRNYNKTVFQAGKLVRRS